MVNETVLPKPDLRWATLNVTHFNKPSMSFLFGKRKKSPGGSDILRYRDVKPSEIPIGCQDEPTAQFAAAREKIYEQLFGPVASVYHEVIPMIPHIDVYTFPANQNGRNFCTLATGGMSNLPMERPRNQSEVTRRVELIFYCSEPKPEYLETLRFLARFPHDYKTSVAAGDTIPNGNPPAPIWGISSLDTILFMPTIVKRDQTLPQQLNFAGDPVEFLWVVPLTTSEGECKLLKGYNAIIDLFQQNKHPVIFDPTRKSYV